ncbi:hypothetical protein [Clostridium cochlearium]|uniref:hypothetical protein n=1 Tax=Clostridium cochlearium TaxID=1494 RepID=UPI00167BA936|nr:hypothetical protein [Clostridium cochlearium]
MKTIQVPRKNLGTKIGSIVDKDYKGNTVVAYAYGVIPVRIATDMSQKEFDKLFD